MKSPQKIKIDLHVSGNGLYMAYIKHFTEIPFKITQEFEAISKTGRYKGKPSPYGLGYVECTDEPMLIYYLNILMLYRKRLHDIGVNDVRVDLFQAKKISQRLIDMINISLEYIQAPHRIKTGIIE